MPKTEAGTWREFTEQEKRDLMAATFRTMTAWLADHPDLPTVDTWEITSGTATAHLGRNSLRWTQERAEALLETYAAALGTHVRHIEVSEHDGHPALLIEALVPLDQPHPSQRHVEIEIFYLIEKDEDWD
jgi:hypothetical protein